MKRYLPALLLAGCAVDATVTESQAPAGQTEQAPLTRFKLDSSALAVRPAAVAPARALRREKHDVQNIAARLLRAPQSPWVAKAGPRASYRASDWELEVDPATGRIFGNRPDTAEADGVQDEAQLRADALSRLADFGVDSSEVGKVLQRRLMSTDREASTSAAAPRLRAYKTFIFREVNGIPVRGHRAVLTHGKDGVLRKVLMTWPALAATGHRLESRLDVATIEARARAALAREGATGGDARLGWRYVPVPAADGEVTLKLVAIARLAAAQGDGTTEEPRVVEVDVDAR